MKAKAESFVSASVLHEHIQRSVNIPCAKTGKWRRHILLGAEITQWLHFEIGAPPEVTTDSHYAVMYACTECDTVRQFGSLASL